MDKKRPPSHQQTLDFAQDQHWQQLHESVQQECQQVLSRLLKEVLESERNNDERENH